MSMYSIKCCIPGCKVPGVTHHRFPNPRKERKLFDRWLEVINLTSLVDMEPEKVYQQKRICFAHFDPSLKSPGNPRLHFGAVPSRGLPGPSVVIPDLPTDPPGTLENDEIENAMEITERPSTPVGVSIPVPGSPIKCREGELLRAVSVNRKTELSPTARKMYDIANVFKRRAARSQKQCSSFKQRLAAAERYSESEAFMKVARNLTPAAEKFLWLQIRESAKKPKGRRFTMDEKTLALSLYKRSPKGYDLLHEMFSLPCRKTLNNFLAQLKLKPGINKKIFSILEKQVKKMPAHHRICTLVFDEMSIGSSINYSATNDMMEGFVDDGESRNVAFADHALVFMARGVIRKWKQPIGFTFCEGATKADRLGSLIRHFISAMQNAGLKVVATVCDQGKPNQKAIRDLVESTRIEYNQIGEEMRGEFFDINGKHIVPLYDSPHLLKCIRNNLIKYDLKFMMDGMEMTAKWQHVVEVYEDDITEEYSDLRELPKLTEAHVRPNHGEKMKVSYCSQVFSQRVAATLRSKAKQCTAKSEMTQTALLFVFLDKLFDSVNGSSTQVRRGKELRTAMKSESPHLEFWADAINVLQSMKYVDPNDPSKKPKPDCLQNWVKTIRGFQLIWENLRGEGIKFLLLRNFNQDPLENFFGSIRSHGLRNINPSCTAFVAAYKTLLINNFMAPHSLGANCELDVSDGALSTLKDLLVKERDMNVFESTIQDANVEVIDVNESNSALLKSNFCCGYVLKKLKKITRNCAQCKADVKAVSVGLQHGLIQEREYLENHELLQYPSFSAVTCFIHVKKLTYFILENYITADDLVKNIKFHCNKRVDFSFLTCENHKLAMKDQIVTETLMLIVYGYIKETNRLLCGKKIVKGLVGDKIKKIAVHKYNKIMKYKKNTK